MLINFTNHPLTQWSEEQKKAANELFGEIVDLPFPNIDPYGDEKYIDELAQQYLTKILEHRPQALHIQGEFTFTYRIIELLKTHNIPCYASTTHRIIEINDDGTRTYKFQFVRFRQYL